MNCRILKKDAFRIVGLCTRKPMRMDDCFEKTALFWQQLHAQIWAAIRSGSPKMILTTQRYFGTANGNQYGIPASSRNVVRNAFNETARDIYNLAGIFQNIQ